MSEAHAAVQTEGRGVRVNSGPGAPGGALGVEADAGRGAGVDARRCTVQWGEPERWGTPGAHLSPSVNPLMRMIAGEQTVSRALGGVTVATKEEHAFSGRLQPEGNRGNSALTNLNSLAMPSFVESR